MYYHLFYTQHIQGGGDRGQPLHYTMVNLVSKMVFYALQREKGGQIFVKIRNLRTDSYWISFQELTNRDAEGTGEDKNVSTEINSAFVGRALIEMTIYFDLSDEVSSLHRYLLE